MDMRLRASQEQFAVILNFMETHGDLSKPQPGVQGRLNCEQRWSELTEILNSVGSGIQKPADKWKRVWSDWKTKTKKKASLINRDTHGTGGGPSKGKLLNPLEERVLKIIGFLSITGHQEVEKAGFTSPDMSISSGHISDLEVPATPEPCNIEDTEAASQYEIGITRLGDVRTSPGPSTPHRQRVLRQRRRQRQILFERATSNFVEIEKGRLRLEEMRIERENIREMERLRIETLRIKMEERRTTVLEKIANTTQDILNLMSQYITSSPRFQDRNNRS